MGIGGISPVQLIIILVIVLLIFGTKKLRNLGGDLGGAIKGFKKAVKEEGHKKQENTEQLEDAEPDAVQDFAVQDSGDEAEQTVAPKKKGANKNEEQTEKEI